MKVKAFLCIIFTLSQLSCVSLFAGKFGEHKFIGDLSFNKAVEGLDNSNLFLFNPNSEFSLFLNSYGKYIFRPFCSVNGDSVKVSYGVLTGLSADHSFSPTRLIDGLITPYSSTILSLSEHEVSISRFSSSAEDSKLLEIDFSYAWLAIEDLSHFYDASSDIFEHYNLKKDYFKLIQDISDFTNSANRDSLTFNFFEKLRNVNLIQKYIYLHTFSLELAIQSNKCINDTNSNKRKNLILYSFLVNSFADHFIQDAFSAGHLPVKRSIVNSWGNRVAHDYFSEIGLDVINLRGESWRSYGDNFMNKNNFSLDSIYTNFGPINNNIKLAIEADSSSIGELLEVYSSKRVYSLVSDILIHFNNTTNEDKLDYFKKEFNALNIIPIPLSTLSIEFLEEVSPSFRDSSKSNTFRENYYRNYYNFSSSGVQALFNKISLVFGQSVYSLKSSGNLDEYPLPSLLFRLEVVPTSLYNPTSYDAKLNYLNRNSLWLGFNLGLESSIDFLKYFDGLDIELPQNTLWRYSLELGSFIRWKISDNGNEFENIITSFRFDLNYYNDLQAADHYSYLSPSVSINFLNSVNLIFGYYDNLELNSSNNFYSFGIKYNISNLYKIFSVQPK